MFGIVKCNDGLAWFREVIERCDQIKIGAAHNHHIKRNFFAGRIHLSTVAHH
jgi:hypothetical protein